MLLTVACPFLFLDSISARISFRTLRWLTFLLTLPLLVELGVFYSSEDADCKFLQLTTWKSHTLLLFHNMMRSSIFVETTLKLFGHLIFCGQKPSQRCLTSSVASQECLSSNVETIKRVFLQIVACKWIINVAANLSSWKLLRHSYQTIARIMAYARAGLKYCKS